MSAPIVVVGHEGMLGRAWMELLASRGIPVRGVGRPALDLEFVESISSALHGPVRAVVNCAAYTDVDGAESDEDRAFAVNGRGVEHLVRRCDELGMPLVHYSTDYVFDGHPRNAPYAVDQAPAPLNAYGRSKLAGERAIAASTGQHLIIRTSWVYAPWGKNFVRTIAKLATQRDELEVVDDQRGRPTSAEHLASVSLELFEAGHRGMFHVCDGSECTWFELASAIVERIGARCRVEPCSSDAFPRPARRPSYSVLDLSKTEQLLGPMRAWPDNLASVLSRLEARPPEP